MSNTLELFFSPLACSMAGRIALYEAGASASFREVDPHTKRTLNDNADFLAVNPLGLVPALRLEDGSVLTENAAVLQAIAQCHPDSAIALPQGIELSKLQQWLSFIGTELHKGLFIPLFDSAMPAEAHARVLAKGRTRLDHLNTHLADRRTLLERFSIADAYLVTVLNWSMAIPAIDLKDWPNVAAYASRLKQRPSVSRALGEEFALYEAEQKRHRAA